MAHTILTELYKYDDEVTRVMNEGFNLHILHFARVVGSFMCCKVYNIKLKNNTYTSPLKKFINDPNAYKYNNRFDNGIVQIEFFDDFSRVDCPTYRVALETIYREVEGLEPSLLNDEFLAQWYITKGSKAAVMRC